MDFLFNMLATVMAFIYDAVPSFGFAIVALTLVVMIVLTPLTLKGTRSMMMMQQLQPEMKKLQSKYKDDKQKLNEELLKFYKENNINPVGGCLPLLVQMPVFIVLYNVLRGMTQRVPIMGADVGWVSGQQFGLAAPPTKPPIILNNFSPAYLPEASQMFHDLRATNVMKLANFLPLDLAQSAGEALQQGVGHSIPFMLLIIVVGISGFVQQRQIQGRTPANQINPQQQQIMKIMPIFLPVVSFGLPAGLVLYFAVSNLYRIGQQWFISRSIYGLKRGQTVEDLEAAKGKGSGSSDNKKRPAKGGPATSTNGSSDKATKAKPVAKKAPAKQNPAKPTPAKPAASGRSGKPAASSGSNGKGKSEDRARPETTPTSPRATRPDTTPRPKGSPQPLQPRARRNKKR